MCGLYLKSFKFFIYTKQGVGYKNKNYILFTFYNFLVYKYFINCILNKQYQFNIDFIKRYNCIEIIYIRDFNDRKTKL